jgi:hypothetical protein
MAIVIQQLGRIIPDSNPRARKLRIELALALGGTLGAFTVWGLHARGKHKQAEALTGAGIVVGGLLSMWRIAEELSDEEATDVV